MPTMGALEPLSHHLVPPDQCSQRRRRVFRKLTLLDSEESADRHAAPAQAEGAADRTSSMLEDACKLSPIVDVFERKLLHRGGREEQTVERRVGDGSTERAVIAIEVRVIATLYPCVSRRRTTGSISENSAASGVSKLGS